MSCYPLGFCTIYMRFANRTAWGMTTGLRVTSLAVILLFVATGVFAQSGRKQRGGNSKSNPQPAATPTATPELPTTPVDEDPEPVKEIQDIESVKIQTNLVTVPIIVSDRNEIYVPDMQQGEFTLEENGVKQDIAFFASITQPFHVVLMIDTSGSTQEKLGQIQRAATAFVDELQPQDRIKVISFDDQIRDYGAFTNDRQALRRTIESMRSGKGTKLYDAMFMAMRSLQGIDGRKAIVIFTDGVDWTSDRATYDENRRDLEEAGIIVYPIRYETRADTERIVREQQRGGRSVDLGSVLGGGGSTTPPAVPGTSIPLPPGTGDSTPTIGGIPIPPIYIPQRRDPNQRNDPFPDPNDPSRRGGGTTSTNIDAMLDMAYATADAYLRDLALITGGKLYRADTLGSLPVAFANIAAELRTQYSLGYYPTNLDRDGKFRKIKVQTTRKGVIVRARPGYRVPR
jgi:VWFA-related protein